MYAMKSSSTAHIRNAMSILAASLRIQRISFICDVCDMNPETYESGAPGGLYLVHFRRNVMNLSRSGVGICFGGNIVAAPSHRRPVLYSAVMNSGVFFSM